MKITGYCMKCHRIRNVRVSSLVPRRVPIGICGACEEKEEQTRRSPGR